MSHFGRTGVRMTKEEAEANQADAANQQKMTGEMIDKKAAHSHEQADKHMEVAKGAAKQGNGEQAQQSAKISHTYRQAGLHYDAASQAHGSGDQEQRNASFQSGNQAQGQADDLAMSSGTPDK